MGFEAVEIGVMECLDGRFFDRSVHPFDLAVSSRMIWFSELVLDAILSTYAIEDMWAEILPGWSIAVLRQIGERHAVIGKHSVDGIREGLDYAAQELCAVHLSGVIAELDVSKFGYSIDRQEHVELSFGQTQFTDVDMDVADGSFGELPAFCTFICAIGQP